ncbi:hypothetical protein MVEN_00866800 [Mycena venus]|uniref:Secreted protein n=1 Tax=Mycena venus TaxID=2733690 RepID=A0A8H6YFS5_9AGAR|nr:hypothetical protein MVEN_00866800 [Mycena venus]
MPRTSSARAVLSVATMLIAALGSVAALIHTATEPIHATDGSHCVQCRCHAHPHRRRIHRYLRLLVGFPPWSTPSVLPSLLQGLSRPPDVLMP